MKRRKKGLSFYHKEHKYGKNIVREVLTYVVWTAVMLLLSFVIVYCFGIRLKQVGESMEPTLYNAEEVFVNRFLYFFTNPERLDVVVFKPNGNENSHYYVKRVIGLPGETIQITGGSIYINDTLYIEDGLYPHMESGGIAEHGITLGEDEFFVLGDNRNNSEDSRHGNVGVVKKDYILGKAWFHGSAGDGIAAGFIK